MSYLNRSNNLLRFTRCPTPAWDFAIMSSTWHSLSRWIISWNKVTLDLRHVAPAFLRLNDIILRQGMCSLVWWTLFTSYHLAIVDLVTASNHQWRKIPRIEPYYQPIHHCSHLPDWLCSLSSPHTFSPSHPFSKPTFASLEDSPLLMVAYALRHWYSTLVCLDTTRRRYQYTLSTGLPFCSRLASDLGGTRNNNLDSLLVRLNHLFLLLQQPG